MALEGHLVGVQCRRARRGDPAHFPGKGKGKKRGQRKPRADAGKKAEPKYRDPKTGTTWSGRGRPAAWLKAHMDAGKKKEDFLIKK